MDTQKFEDKAQAAMEKGIADVANLISGWGHSISLGQNQKKPKRDIQLIHRELGELLAKIRHIDEHLGAVGMASPNDLHHLDELKVRCVQVAGEAHEWLTAYLKEADVPERMKGKEAGA